MVFIEYKTADANGRGWIFRPVHFFVLFQSLEYFFPMSSGAEDRGVREEEG